MNEAGAATGIALEFTQRILLTSQDNHEEDNFNGVGAIFNMSVFFLTGKTLGLDTHNNYKDNNQ